MEDTSVELAIWVGSYNDENCTTDSIDYVYDSETPFFLYACLFANEFVVFVMFINAVLGLHLLVAV